MLNIAIIVALSALGAIGDISLKKAGHGGAKAGLWIAVGTAAYALTIPGWYYVLKHVALAPVGVIYSVSTTLILVGVGVTWFDERLSGIELLGVAFALLAVFSLRRLI